MDSARNKELTAHLRKRLSVCGIKAKVHMSAGCSFKSIRVTVPAFEARFTATEIFTFCTIAKINGLTLTNDMEINPELQQQLTEQLEWTFCVPSAR